MHVPLSPLFALHVGVLAGVTSAVEVGGFDLVGSGAAFVDPGLLPSSIPMQRGFVSSMGRV